MAQAWERADALLAVSREREAQAAAWAPQATPPLRRHAPPGPTGGTAHGRYAAWSRADRASVTPASLQLESKHRPASTLDAEVAQLQRRFADLLRSQQGGVLRRTLAQSVLLGQARQRALLHEMLHGSDAGTPPDPRDANEARGALSPRALRDELGAHAATAIATPRHREVVTRDCNLAEGTASVLKVVLLQQVWPSPRVPWHGSRGLPPVWAPSPLGL